MFLPGRISTLLSIFFIFIICFTIFDYFHKVTYTLTINAQSSPINIVSAKFLSVGIDTSLIYSGVSNMKLHSARLIDMASKLKPAHIRFGGTMSDRLIFMKNSYNIDILKYKGYSKFLPFFTMDESDWLQINDFCNKTGLRLLFDLNVLLRNENSWDSTNAKYLMNFSRLNDLQNIDWQLGNEPNSFNHVFNVTVKPNQLSRDFKELKTLLQIFYPYSRLVGPDTTRPQPKRPDCVLYMREFLSEASAYIDAIGWHQYYLNGRTASIQDFWNPDVMNLLQSQIDTMNLNIDKYKHNKTMWLTETSSAYGGGAPGLSNSFSSSPLWLDKLGIAAQNGIEVVIRQSLIGGYYSLIDNNLEPLPDWWVSVIFKRLVGEKVISCKLNSAKFQRLYCHCAKQEQNMKNSIVIFGVNLVNSTVNINIEGDIIQMESYIDEYILSAPSNNITSQKISLNGELLEYNNNIQFQPKRLTTVNKFEMLPNSMGFWVVHNIKNIKFC